MTTDVVIKILAVVGGGVAGGLGLGLLVQLLMRAMAIRNPPRWSILTIRLLGIVICGWFVALWLFGGGGPGIGGTGGWGFGSGSGKGEGEKAVESSKKNGEVKKKDGETKTPEDQTLRIEVLGNAALSSKDIQEERRYLLGMEQGPLLTFAEVKDRVRKPLQEQPSLRYLEIILYNDSPAEDNLLVSQLKKWGQDLNGGKMTVKTSKSNVPAPKK
jgi:hypothetical protein